MLLKHDIMILYIIFQLFQCQCQNIQNPGPRGTFCDYVGPQEENQFPWQVYNKNHYCPLWVFTVMGWCNWSSYVCMCAFIAGTISLQAFLLPSYSEGHIIIVDSLLPVPLTVCSERLQSIKHSTFEDMIQLIYSIIRNCTCIYVTLNVKLWININN